MTGDGRSSSWMARPEGTERAVQILEIEGVGEPVEALQAA